MEQMDVVVQYTVIIMIPKFSLRSVLCITGIKHPAFWLHLIGQETNGCICWFALVGISGCSSHQRFDAVG